MNNEMLAKLHGVWESNSDDKSRIEIKDMTATDGERVDTLYWRSDKDAWVIGGFTVVFLVLSDDNTLILSRDGSVFGGTGTYHRVI